MDVIGTRRARTSSRLATTYQLIRSNPTGRTALRSVVALLGGLVVAVGITLIPLPGPGWAIVLLGLSIWAIEFAWARHLLRFTREQLRRWWRWIGARSWLVRVALGAAGLLLVATIAWASLRASFGIDLVANIVEYVTTH